MNRFISDNKTTALLLAGMLISHGISSTISQDGDKYQLDLCDGCIDEKIQSILNTEQVQGYLTNEKKKIILNEAKKGIL